MSKHVLFVMLVFLMSFNVFAQNNSPVMDISHDMKIYSVDMGEQSAYTAAVVLLQWQADYIYTDADGDTCGIAIVGADNSNGQWVSVDYGNITGVTPGNALLIDQFESIYFEADPGFNTTSNPKPTIQYKAWDKTAGSPGDFVTTIAADPFSAEVETATCRVAENAAVNNHLSIIPPRYKLFPFTAGTGRFHIPISLQGYETDPEGDLMTFVGVGGLFSSGPAVTSNYSVIYQYRDSTYFETASYQTAEGGLDFNIDFGGQNIEQFYFGFGDNLDIWPYTVNDEVNGTEDTPSTYNVTSNDTKGPWNSNLKIHSFQAVTAEGGTVEIDSMGTPDNLYDDRLRYTPVSDFFGTDSFYYKIQSHATLISPDSSWVIIDVQPVNDPPEIDSSHFTVAENSAPGTNVGTVTANDAENDDFSFSITGGNIGSTFQINSSTGQISVNNNDSLDYEKYPEFLLEISAQDVGIPNKTGTQDILISLLNQNEPPVIDSVAIIDSMVVNPGETITLDEGTTTHFSAAAQDPEGGTLYYKWELNDQIISSAREVTLTLDYISHFQSPYVLRLTISDSPFTKSSDMNISKNELRKKYLKTGEKLTSVFTWTLEVLDVDGPIVVDDLNIPNGHIYINEDETKKYFIDAYDADMEPLEFEWKLNGSIVSNGSEYNYTPDPVKKKDKGSDVISLFVSDQNPLHELNYSFQVLVLNADNPIVVSSVTPAPNTSTDPTVSTAGGSYNMTEGETLNFSVDADDADGSLLWRNWYVNDELVWLDPDFDFNTHFMSSGGSPYDIKLFLQGQQGDYQEFHWTVNVSNKEAVTYANSPMILNGTAMIEGLNAESGDAIAAYSGNELRGEILLNDSNFDNFIINLSENNEEISFVIYDSNNNIIKTVHRTISGEINTAQEITLHGYKEVSNSFVLAENWNYVSFNTIPEDNSVSSVFTNINVSQIQTVNEVYSSSNPEFLNTLKEIKPGIGYLVKMNSNSSIFVNGYSAENSEIQLYEGWNLIGYTERSSSDIETAFGSVMDKIIEIKSEIGVFSADMPAYMNTLSYIEKNKAYWVKCSENCVLDFPRIESKENYNKLNGINHLGTGSSDYAIGGESTLNTYSTSPTRPPVNVSFGNIAVRTNSFVVYAEIQNPSDNTLCAYNNNELRGISQIVENNNKYYTSIVVNSDIEGEEITLKIGDSTIKTISSIPGKTIGKDNLLQLDGSLENEIPASFKVSLFPNPFNPEINISFELPKAERINISVFDINGKLVNTLEDNMFNSGKHSITWNGTDSNNNKMASGIYFVKVKSDSYNTTEKIVMLK